MLSKSLCKLIKLQNHTAPCIPVYYTSRRLKRLRRQCAESLCFLTYGYDLGIYWLFKGASNGSELTASILSKISTDKRWGAAGLRRFS